MAKEMAVHLGAVGYHESRVWTDGSPWTKFELLAKGETVVDHQDETLIKRYNF